MSTYHCHTHAISRSGKSGSALACAAYRSGEALRERSDKRALSAAELAAYRTGGSVADGSGKVHDYTRKGGVAHCEIVLPEGVDAAWAQDRAVLWNQAEAAERRINSRVAREWRVALPHELNHGQRVALAKDFASVIVERYGVAADVAVHAPSRSGDQRNWHAHILCTTRRIGNKGFGAKAELEWSNTNLAKEGLPYSSLQIRELRMAWEERTNEALAAAGHEVRVDHRSYAEQGVGLEAARTVHVGQLHAEDRDARLGTARILPVERLDREQSVRNAAAIEGRPELLLDRVTAQASVFTRQDVARGLHRFVNEDWDRFERTLNAVMASGTLVCLVEGGQTVDTGREVEPVWTTKAVATREAEMLDRAERLATARDGGLSARAIAKGIASIEKGKGRDGGQTIHLSDEQRTAVRTLGGEGQLAILRGVAGTGKTTALSAYRVAAQREGVRVIGGALAGKAARELEGGSGIESRTLASWERSWEAGFDRLGKGDVLVMDEAGMVGAAQMARVMETVEKAEAKLILVGDERQLQPIEAGAAFRTIKERLEERGDSAELGATAKDGARGRDRTARKAPIAELAQVRRQSSEWQRGAAEAFGRGEAGEALDAYRARGEVRLHDSTELTHKAIVTEYFRHRDEAVAAQMGAGKLEAQRGWMAGLRSAIGLERRTGGEAARTAGRDPDHIVTAYRNADVEALNAAIRGERVQRGELRDGASFRTDQGKAEFAKGDLVLLTANDRELGVANGDRGVVMAAGPNRLSVRTRDGRDVELAAERYGGVRHGYAVTTHRAQGMTVDRVHVMAGQGMHASLAYVAMTRQREGATLHASRDHFRDYATLRESISRERPSLGVGDYLPKAGRALTAVAERVAATQAARRAQQARERTAETSMEGSKAQGEADRSSRLRAAFAERPTSRAAEEERRARLREAFGSERKAPDRMVEDQVIEDRSARLRAAFQRSPERAAGDEEARRQRLREAFGKVGERKGEASQDRMARQAGANRTKASSTDHKTTTKADQQSSVERRQDKQQQDGRARSGSEPKGAEKSGGRDGPDRTRGRDTGSER